MTASAPVRDIRWQRLVQSPLLQITLVLAPVLIQAALLVREFLNWTPVWASYADPGYQYLLSGTVIVEGGTPLHNDHPGTSIQWLIGLSEAVTHGMAGTGTLADDVVTRPEFYAQVSGAVLATLYLASLALAAVRLHRHLGVWASLTFQLVMLWGLPLLAIGRFRLMPESLVITCSVAVLAIAAPLLASPRRDATRIEAILIGVVSAIGITSKILFAPVIIAILVLLGRKQLLVMIASLVGAAAVIFIPVFSRFDYMAGWFLGILVNPGRQGQAGGSRRPLAQFADSMLAVNATVRWFVPVLLVILTAAVVAVLLGSRQRHAFTWRPQLALLAALAIVLAAGIKPAEVRDFIVAIPLLAAIAAISFATIRALVTATAARRLLSTGWVLLFAFIAAHGVVGSVYMSDANRARVAAVVENAVPMEQVIHDGSDGSWALGYNAWTIDGALLYTMPWMDDVVGRAIARRNPSGLHFDLWGRAINEIRPSGAYVRWECSDLSTALRSGPVGIIVESRGHLKFDGYGKRIELLAGNAGFEGPEPVGDYYAYRLTDIACTNGATS